MKAIKIAFSVTILMAIFLSIGFVSAAITSNDVTISAYLSNSSLRPGDQIVVNVTFDSKVAQELEIYAIGIHADWMQAETLQGPNYYSSDSGPVTVEANGLFSTRFVASVPVGTSFGAHTYYIGVDGADSSGTQQFSLNSAESTLQVVSSTSSSTPSPTSTQDGGLGDTSGWLPYIVVGVVAAVMVLLVILTMMRGRKKKEPSKSQDETNYNQPVSSPEPETDQGPKSKEDNFSI